MVVFSPQQKSPKGGQLITRGAVHKTGLRTNRLSNYQPYVYLKQTEIILPGIASSGTTGP